MKYPNPIYFIAILTTLFFFSCSSSEETGGTVTPPPVSTVTSIVLSSDKTSFDEGNSVIFTVKTNLNATVTSESSFKVNGTSISGNTYTPTSPGTYTVVATHSTFTSNQVTLTVNEVATVTSIEITSSELALAIGQVTNFNVVATYSDGTTEDKTADCQYVVNNTIYNGSGYLATEVGAITAKATFSSLSSNEITIQVSDVSLPTTYTKKAIIEDYTGTWCGWCPRVSYAISLVEAETDKVFAVGAHIGDAMENSYSSALDTAFDIPGYPSAFVNREADWDYPEPSNVAQAVNTAQGSTNVGLAVGATLDGSTMNILVSTGFAESVSGTKIVVFVLEDGILANQANYTSYYGGGSNLSNFEHNHVLRYSATAVLGDDTESGLGLTHKPYSVNLSSYAVSNVANTAVLAFLTDATGKVVLNAQYTKVNQSTSFD